MMLQRQLIFLFLFLITNTLYASDSYINKKMQQASQNLIDLMPYIYDDDAFRSPENKQSVEQNINSLIEIMNDTPHLGGNHGLTSRISQQTLLSNLKQAYSLYSSGAYATAQYLLSGVPLVCSSCHIQDGQQSSMATGVKRELFANDFSYGEFNYYLRNYEQAKSSYEEYLKAPEVQRSRIRARKTLERLLDISLITAQQAQPAKDTLEWATQLPELNNESTETIAHWEEGIAELQFNTPSLQTLEQNILQSFSEKFTLEHEFIFNEVNRPKALLWRQQLHKTLRNDTSSADVARTLYLLSILERALGDQVNISLASMYLKECVQLRVKDYSSRCLSEYENHLLFYYGGSSGEHLPDSVLRELDDLKKQL